MTVSTATTIWRPVLTDRFAERATEAVREIAEALFESSFDEPADGSIYPEIGYIEVLQRLGTEEFSICHVPRSLPWQRDGRSGLKE